MSPDKLWKASERRVAALLGGTRVPVSGRARGDNPDVSHRLLSTEVKMRTKLPALYASAMKQAQASAKEGEVPVVVMHEKGKRYDEALVMFRMKDFLPILEAMGDNRSGSL